MIKKIKPEYRFEALLLDIIYSSKYKNDPIELVNQLLGRFGLCLTENKIEYYKHVASGFFDALAKKENKEYFINYFENFKVISELLQFKSKKIHRKYEFFYNYLKNNKVPIRLKDLKITGLDIKEKYPKIIIPKNPREVIAQKLVDSLTREFFEEFGANIIVKKGVIK